MAWYRAFVCFFCSCIVAVFGASPDGEYDALLHGARAAYLGARYAEADELYTTAIERIRSEGSAGEALARPLYEFGAVRKVEGRCEEASDLIMSGIQILEGASPADAHELSQAWRLLAASYYCGHLYSRAEAAYRRSLDLEQHSAAPRRAAIFDSQSGLAATYQNLGKLTRAEEAYRAARAVEDDPQISPRARAFLLANLGSLLRLEGRNPESEATLREGLAILRRGAGRYGTVTAYLLNNLALIDMDRKNYRDAAGLLREATALLQDGHPVQPGDAAPLLHNYALCLRKTGHKRDAKTVESQLAKLAVRVPPDRERGMLTDVAQLMRGK